MRLTDRFWRMVNRSDACWTWQGSTNRTGYGRLNAGSHQGPVLLAHRVAWELATDEPIPAGLDVLHTCDEPACVRNDDEGTYEVGGRVLPRRGHLFLGTQADNMADMIAKNRVARGSRRRRSNLTEEAVIQIRQLAKDGHRHSQLAERFQVSQSSISRIVARELWQHV